MFSFFFSLLYRKYGKPISYSRMNSFEAKMVNYSLIELFVMEILIIVSVIYLICR